MALLLILVAAGSDLTEAIRAYEALDFRGARAILVGIVDDPGLSRAERIEALAYLGRAHAVLGEPVRAQRRFEAVLALDPDYAVAWEESPRIREVFDAARKRAEQRAVERASEPPASPPKKKSARPRLDPPRAAKSAPDTVIPAVTPKPAPAIPPPRVAQAEPQESSLTTWLIVGGAALATVGVIVAIIVAGSGDDGGRTPTATWRLP